MSEQGRRKVRPDDEVDERPMLVLGQEQPDVEDTTTEELARQRAELEEERRQAQERLEQQEREAAERLAEERRQAEKALAARQRALDAAERKLYKTERRLQRQAKASGQEVPAVTPGLHAADESRDTQADKGSLLAAAEQRSATRAPRMGQVATLAVFAGALGTLGSVLVVAGPGEEKISTFVTADDNRQTWLEAALQLDDEVVRYLTGEDPTRPDGTLESVATGRAAVDGSRRWYFEQLDEEMAPLLTQEGSSDQRVLSTWSETRQGLGYTVSNMDVRRAGEDLNAINFGGSLLLLGGVVLAGGLAVSLKRGGTRTGAALAGLAVVPMGLVATGLVGSPRLGPPLEAHDAAVTAQRQAFDQLDRDLETLLGMRSLGTYELDDYWEDAGELDDEDHDPGPLRAYAAARAPIAELDIRALSTAEAAEAARGLVTTGSALIASDGERIAQLRGAVVDAADTSVGTALPLVLGSALLPLAALVPAALRRKEVDG